MELATVYPNYVNERSKSSEVSMDKLIQLACDLGPDIKKLVLDKSSVLEMVERLNPKRLSLVKSKLAEEGRTLEELDPSSVMDRILGIDKLIEYNGEKFAIDVTSGNGTLLYNKTRKFQELKPVFTELGIDHAVVISLTETVSTDLVSKFLSDLKQMPDNQFSKVLKYRDSGYKQ